MVQSSDLLVQKGSVVLVMGPPNAGKDHQARMLAERSGALCIGSGEVLRRDNDPRLLKIMASGDLVPPADVRRLMGRALAAVPLEQPIVLAGTTKRPEEAEWLLEYLPTLERRLERVVLISISPEVSFDRSQRRGRPDDYHNVQDERWRKYRQETLQSVEVFRRAGLVAEVDGEGTLDEVAVRIDKVLKG